VAAVGDHVAGFAATSSALAAQKVSDSDPTITATVEMLERRRIGSYKPW
jgi:hypothetical protein